MFFLDQIVLALQAHETLAGRTSTLLPLGLAVASLVVTSGLAIVTDADGRYDAWSAGYAVVFTAFHATILAAWWSELDATYGAIAVAYLVSPLTRTYLLGADAHATILAVAVVFLVVDAVFAGFVGASLSGFFGPSFGGSAWIPLGLIGSAVTSIVVCAWIAAAGAMYLDNSKKNVLDYLEMDAVGSESTPEVDKNVEAFVVALKREVDVASADAAERIEAIEGAVEEIVAYADELATIGERADLVKSVLDISGGGGGAWNDVVNVVRTDETLEEMGMTRRVYESASRLDGDGRRESPADFVGAAVFASGWFKKLNCGKMFAQRLSHATSRRSFATASRAKKVEALWKILSW